jgi:NADPH:quinone reductase-like Zn-dependent oxidoreductase
MIDYVSKKALKPVVSEVIAMERAAAGFALMEKGGQFGKIVIRVS